MDDSNNEYSDFLISTRPDGGVTKGILQRQIDTDFILDLYDKYREMPKGEVRETFKATIKVFEENIGKYLILACPED